MSEPLDNAMTRREMMRAAAGAVAAAAGVAMLPDAVAADAVEDADQKLGLEMARSIKAYAVERQNDPPELMPYGQFLDLWWQLRNLCTLVQKAREPGDELYEAFEATQEVRGDIVPDEASLDILREAYVQFFGLPKREQRRILNGWKPRPIPPSQDNDLDELVDMWGPVRAMMIIKSQWTSMVKDETGHYPQGPSSWSELSVVPNLAGVGPGVVLIREGAERAEVLQMLDMARKMVEGEWKAMIEGQEVSCRVDGDSCVVSRDGMAATAGCGRGGWSKIKSGLPESSINVAQLGGKNNVGKGHQATAI